jgi:orotate phosphoribosyltransferase
MSVDYLAPLLDQVGGLERKAVEVSRALQGLEFETIVVTGVSGLLVGPLVSVWMDKRLVVVRRTISCRNTHSSYWVEGPNPGRWIFLDDLIATGKTLRRVRRRISTSAGVGFGSETFIGVVLYHNSGSGHNAEEVVFHSAETISGKMGRWGWKI